MATRVKHHGLAHLALFVLLFVLGSIVFNDPLGGPLTSGLLLGAKVYGFVALGASGNLEATSLLGGNLLQLLLLFLIQVSIYYALSTVLIFLWNLVWKK